MFDRLRVVFHKKLKNCYFNSKNILSVKMRLGFKTKHKVGMAGREHLLLNHPPLYPFGSKGSTIDFPFVVCIPLLLYPR